MAATQGAGDDRAMLLGGAIVGVRRQDRAGDVPHRVVTGVLVIGRRPVGQR